MKTQLINVPAKIPRVAVYLPEDLHARLEIEASNEERSLSQMSLILIREALDGRDKRRQSQDTQADK